MANPPVNRRPGVDADTIQGTWVRGYDVPAGDQTLPVPSPCDLIVSNGKSQIDQTLSNLIFAQRTNSPTQPVFVMAQGDDPKTPIGTVGFHIGNEDDPNGLISGVGPGSLYASYGTPGLWQLQGDDTTWEQISDELGGEDLQETLAIGNTTGGFNILLTNGDFLKGEDNAVGDGASANIAGGNATGGTGDGGGVLVQGGTSVGGVTGGITASTPTATGSGGSGLILLQTGDSQLGGNSGGVSITVGDAGDVGFGGDAGNVFVSAGRNRSSGAGAFGGGRVSLVAGQATAAGQGGDIILRAGPSSDVDSFILTPTFVAGRGGDIRLTAGGSSLSEVGGEVVISGGVGGSGGAAGGNVTLTPGNGGGGFPDGEVIADGVFRADNIKRGSGEPNGVVSGNEGDVYQRTDLGLGQIWLNTNGTTTGWAQLAFSGDFIENFEQLNFGYFSRAGHDVGGSAEDAWSATGVFKGLLSNSTAFNAPTVGGLLENGPYVSFLPSNTGDVSAIDATPGSGGTLPHAREQRFLLTFRARNAVSATDGRIFLGVSTLDGQAQTAGSAIPGGGSYLGFVLDGGVDSTWQVVTSNGVGTTGPLDTGVEDSAVNSTADAWHFIIDATDTATPTVKFLILDQNYVVQSVVTVPTTLPAPGDGMGLVMAARRIADTVSTPTLQVVHANLVNDADVSGQGGGTGFGSLSLSQVLINGNTTGSESIEINQGSNIIGVPDDNAGDGTTYTILSGATSGTGNDTGDLTVASANRSVTGTGVTGDMFVSSGSQIDAGATGDTGTMTVGTGSHGGTGSTGDIIIATGAHLGAGGPQGNILIGPGTFTPNPATATGRVEIKGGSTTLTGVTSGEVLVQSGENNSAQGDTGDVTVNTFAANIDGDSGDLVLFTGSSGTNAGDSGAVTVSTGASPAGNTGGITVSTGAAGAGTAGAVSVTIGSTTTGDGSDVSVTAGDTTDAGGSGGDIQLTPGTGPTGDGAVVVNGKLTVTGAIDPTALLLEGQASIPSEVVPNASQGTLWVDNTGASGQLIFTNSDGDNNITTGGGVTALGALTDVTLTGPVAGEVLTFNGADWVNLAGVGGSPLSTILAIGNTTGSTPIVVENSLGSRITSDGDLVLDPAVAAGNKVVIDGFEWPESDGSSGFVLTTNGSGVLSFQPGGGGTGPSFGEAFTRMQWGSVQAATTATFEADGVFTNVTVASSTGPVTSNDSDGYKFNFDTAATSGSSAGVSVESGGVGIELQSLPFASFKFDAPDIDEEIRFFVGLTTAATTAAQTGSTAPAESYIGLQIYTDVPQTTFHFVTDNNTGTPTTQNTTITASGTGFELTVDATVSGQVSLALHDNTGAQLASHTFSSNLPTNTLGLGLQVGMTTTENTAKASAFYGASAVTRGDLLNAVSGGGGNQNLASVLGFGNETNGVPIQGDDSVTGSGGSLDLQGGSSSGGGGAGGAVNVVTGSADPGGVGGGGNFTVATATGAGTGDAGDFAVSLGDGGPGGGNGGSFAFSAGDGIGVGNGGAWDLTAGDSGTSGGAFSGGISFTTGSGGAGSGATGGRFRAFTGDGDGTGNGGLIELVSGDGGAGGGNGGSVLVSPGTGNGGGADGIIMLDGNTTVTGKLTVTGMIDPPGLLMSSSGSPPFVPAGSEGGIWVNASGELVFTNLGGDLNLSTAIGGGMTFLDALLTAGYGMISAGNPTTGLESYGVYGGSSVVAVSPGPPPASTTFGDDSDGPFLNLAVAGDPLSEAFIGAADLFIQRDSQFKARFKFQVTSPAHTDQRIFVGFTDDPAIVTPSAQLAADDPAAQQYMGIRQDLTGANFDFVSRGSGGAMVPVLGIPTDAAVHYLEIDASDPSGDVTFSIIGADGTTVEATHTESASLLLPDLPTSLRPFFGIHTATGTTPRGMDFYYSTIVTRADVVDAVTGGGGGGTPALESVLAAGNTAGGTSIEADGGVAGGAVTLALSGGAGGGAGSPATLDLAIESGDDGGDATLLAGNGGGGSGAGGGVTINAGDGDTTGAGGDTSLTSGNGGATSGNAGNILLGSGTVTSGDIGVVRITNTALEFIEQASVPGPAIAATQGRVWVKNDAPNTLWFTDDGGTDHQLGLGGITDTLAAVLATGNTTGGTDLEVSSGDKIVTADGSVSDGVDLVVELGDGIVAGKGGDFQLLAGGGGPTDGNGGDITLLAGTGAGSGDGGDVILTGGAGGTSGTAPPGDTRILGGQSRLASQPGGNASVIGGSGGSVAAAGGMAIIMGGAPGTGGNVSGAVAISTQDGAGSGNKAGDITLSCGVGVAGDVAGATISSTSGAGLGTGAGGSNSLVAGAGGATGDGGDIELTSGAGGSTSGDSGDVVISSGTVTSGTNGDVTIHQGDTPEANAVRHRTARLVTAPDAGTVTLKVAHTLTVNETAVSLRGDVTGMSQTDADDLVRGTFEGTWFRSGGTVSAGIVNLTSNGTGGALTDSPAWSVVVDVSGDDIRIRVTGSTVAGTNTNVTWVANWTAQLVS